VDSVKRGASTAAFLKDTSSKLFENIVLREVLGLRGSK